VKFPCRLLCVEREPLPEYIVPEEKAHPIFCLSESRHDIPILTVSDNLRSNSDWEDDWYKPLTHPLDERERKSLISGWDKEYSAFECEEFCRNIRLHNIRLYMMIL
jgi:hypothetical protein